MKIGILTLPLWANYGGIIQNYALQQALKRLGHEPVTINFQASEKLGIKIKTFIYRYLYAKTSKSQSSDNPIFFEDKINYIKLKGVITKREIKRFNINGFVVGSDQVWRPLYNWRRLDKMFLSFIPKNNTIKRVAYAASFGSDEWEYTDEQTMTCRELVQRFDAVSVREDSGVTLCKEHFNIDAVHVLDPTLLLNKEHYSQLCADVPFQKKCLCAYILDLSEREREALETIAAARGLELKVFSADSDCTLTIEQWLAIFRDAEMVITNSFHGTVFSIIFNKEFYSVTHPIRGGSRIPSLFRQLGIPQNRIVTDIRQIQTNNSTPLDWNVINARINEHQQYSITFLQNALTE